MGTIFEDITIITVLYNSSELVEKFFGNLKNFKIVVVDNGQNEKIINKIKDYNNISIISKNKNLGYGRAINFASEHISSKYFLVLNPDLTINLNSINNLYKAISKYENCGIVAPITIPDNDFFGTFPEKNIKNNFSSDLNKSRNLLLNSKIDGDLCVDIAKGCALLINKNYFKKIGKFNEKYFLFWEEIDLCRKLKSKKISVIITPTSTAHHIQGNSSKKNIKNFFLKVFHNEYSPLIYFNVYKLNFFLFRKILKYIFRGFLYLLILNIKKSLINFIKLFANVKYFIDLKFSSKD